MMPSGTQHTLGNVCNPRNSGPEKFIERFEPPHRDAERRAQYHTCGEADGQSQQADENRDYQVAFVQRAEDPFRVRAPRAANASAQLVAERGLDMFRIATAANR